MTKPRRWIFTIDGPPKSKERPRGVKATGHHHTATSTRQYERRVAGAAMEAGLEIGDGQCDVSIRVWVRPSAKSASEPRRRAKIKKDLDNIAKVILDGLLKAGRGALADDNVDHVRSVLCVRAGWSGRERVEIKIVEVLDDAQEMEVEHEC